MDQRGSTPKMSEREIQEYRVVDDALRTYPLQPAPFDLLPEVMRRIQPTQPAARWYSPRQGWIYLLGFSLFGGLVLAWRFFSLLPLDWTARLQFRILMWQYHLEYLPPQYTLAAGMGLILAGLVLLAGMVGWKIFTDRPVGSGRIQ
jgi:hypothetical protein